MGKSKQKTPSKEKNDDLSKNFGQTRRYRVRKQQEREIEEELKKFLKETDAGQQV